MENGDCHKQTGHTISRKHDVTVDAEKNDVINNNERTGYVKSSCLPVCTLWRGWKIYKSYDVMFAGLGLASLYLTVLGFHHITIGKILIIKNNKLELDTLVQ